MNEPYFRCNNPKRHLVSVFVCLHKKCTKVGCGLHRRSAFSVDRANDIVFDPFFDDVKPICGIKASRKKIKKGE